MPTAINREQATELLHQAPEDHVRIWRDKNQDCHIVIAATREHHSRPQKKESQGAKIARVLSGTLDHETAELVRKNRRNFRDGFALRDIDLSGEK